MSESLNPTPTEPTGGPISRPKGDGLPPDSTPDKPRPGPADAVDGGMAGEGGDRGDDTGGMLGEG